MSQIDNWRLSTGESKDNPGDLVGDITFELDALGLLNTATLTYIKCPPWKPYTILITLEVHDQQYGWQEVCTMRPINRTGNDLKLWTLQCSPVEDIKAEAGYTGMVPPTSIGWDTQTNLTGQAAPPAIDEWTSTNSKVMGDMVAEFTASTWGVDAKRRAFLAPSNVGNPITISTLLLEDFNCDGFELADYLTQWRCNPGDGWAKYEGTSGIERPTYLPEKMGTGQATFKEVTGSLGAACLAMGTVKTEPGKEIGEPDPPNPLPPDYKPPNPFKSVLGASGAIQSAVHTGTSKALYMVWDFQDWYQNSALVKSNQSTYEPLKATVKLGIRINRFEYTPPPISYLDIPPDIVYMRSGWISSSPEPDLDAVQQWFGGFDIAQPITVSGKMQDALDIDIDRSIPAPQRSGQTLDVADKQPGIRLTPNDVGKIHYVPFEIDEKLFREDLTMPSESGDRIGYGRHYVHLVAAWGIELADLKAGIAEVEFIFEPAEFKMKLIDTIDLSEIQPQLNAPDVIGPIYSFSTPGLIITPALVPTPSGDQYVSNVNGTIKVNEGVRCTARTLTPPRRNGNRAKQVKNERNK